MEGEPLKYRCFLDICDSSWQFCEEVEEKCSSCREEQCSPETAKNIFNQCKYKCQELIGTTTETIQTTEISPNYVSESHAVVYDPTLFWLLVTILACVLILVIFQVFNCLRNKTSWSQSQECLFGKFNRSQSQTQPLIAYNMPTEYQRFQFCASADREGTVKYPIPINQYSDQSSSRVDNMVRDADILYDATVGGNGPNSMTASLEQHA